MWVRPGCVARCGGTRAVGGAAGGAGGAPADHEQDDCREQGRDLASVAWLGLGLGLGSGLELGLGLACVALEQQRDAAGREGEVDRRPRRC